MSIFFFFSSFTVRLEHAGLVSSVYVCVKQLKLFSLRYTIPRCSIFDCFGSICSFFSKSLPLFFRLITLTCEDKYVRFTSRGWDLTNEKNWWIKSLNTNHGGKNPIKTSFDVPKNQQEKKEFHLNISVITEREREIRGKIFLKWSSSWQHQPCASYCLEDLKIVSKLSSSAKHCGV